MAKSKPKSLSDATVQSSTSPIPGDLDASSLTPPVHGVAPSGPGLSVGKKEAAQLLKQRDELSDQIASLKLAGKLIEKQPPGEQKEKASQEQQRQLQQANEQLNSLLSDPRMEAMRPKQAKAALKSHDEDRLGTMLKRAGYLRTGVNAAVKGTDQVLKTVASASPALTTASQVASTIGGVAAVPLSVAQTGISAAKTANSVRHLWKDSGHRDVAQQARQEFKDDRKLAAIAKRIETKHGRNCISHGFDIASNSVDTLGGAINTVGGTVTGTIGLAAGAASFGGATAALATATFAASTATTITSLGITGTGALYSGGRALTSQLKKGECNDAEEAIAKLKQAGYERFDAKDGLKASKQRTNKVEQVAINIPLVSAATQATSGGRRGGINLTPDGLNPVQERAEAQGTPVIDSLSEAPESVRKPSVRERMGNTASNIGRGVSRVTDPVADGVKRAGTFVSDTVTTVTKPIVESKPVQTVAKVGGLAANGMGKAADWTGEKIGNAASTVKHQVVGAAKSVRDTVDEKTRSVRESVGNFVTNKLDKVFDIDKDKIFVSDANLKGLKAMQDHAVKHDMRDLKPRIHQTAKERAAQQMQDKYADVPDSVKKEMKPGALKKEQKELEKEIYKELKAACKQELRQKYQNLDTLSEHVAETKIARDSMSAVKELAGRLREDCAPAFNKRGKTEITAGDLPEDSKAVELARKLGLSDKQIARIATDVSHQETQKIGEQNLAKSMKLR